MATPVTASFPIPPPVPQLPFVDSRGLLTPPAFGFLQELWAAIQGGGGIIDDGSASNISTGLITSIAQSIAQIAAQEALLLGYVAPAAATAGVTPNPTPSVDIEASENLAAGAMVSVWDSTGPKVRNADATDDTKKARGYVTSAYLSGATATVYLPGPVVEGYSGLTIGADYFLDATPGAITDTAPAVSGNVDQLVGFAISTTAIVFQPLMAIGV